MNPYSDSGSINTGATAAALKGKPPTAADSVLPEATTSATPSATFKGKGGYEYELMPDGAIRIAKGNGTNDGLVVKPEGKNAKAYAAIAAEIGSQVTSPEQAMLLGNSAAKARAYTPPASKAPPKGPTASVISPVRDLGPEPRGETVFTASRPPPPSATASAAMPPASGDDSAYVRRKVAEAEDADYVARNLERAERAEQAEERVMRGTPEVPSSLGNVPLSGGTPTMENLLKLHYALYPQGNSSPERQQELIRAANDPQVAAALYSWYQGQLGSKEAASRPPLR